MNVKNLSNKVTANAGLKMLKLKKHSPNIMFGAGVVGVVATVVLASRATLKLDAVLDVAKIDVARTDEARLVNPEAYSEDDQQKDKAIIGVKTAVNIAKLYAPAILVGTASIGLLTGAHVSLNRRNASLTAAYVAVDTAFKKFENRVKEKYGDDELRELKYGVESKEIYSETKEGEPVVETVKHAGDGAYRYAKFFDSTNPNWNSTPEYNLFFLRAQQNYANDRLNQRGFVLLNDVYDALGIDRTKEGMIVGWRLDGKGDGYVDFGIWSDDKMDQFHDFMTGREDALLLDFNVDGTIYYDL